MYFIKLIHIISIVLKRGNTMSITIPFSRAEKVCFTRVTSNNLRDSRVNSCDINFSSSFRAKITDVTLSNTRIVRAPRKRVNIPRPVNCFNERA